MAHQLDNQPPAREQGLALKPVVERVGGHRRDVRLHAVTRLARAEQADPRVGEHPNLGAVCARLARKDLLLAGVDADETTPRKQRD